MLGRGFCSVLFFAGSVLCRVCSLGGSVHWGPFPGGGCKVRWEGRKANGWQEEHVTWSGGGGSWGGV